MYSLYLKQSHFIPTIISSGNSLLIKKIKAAADSSLGWGAVSRDSTCPSYEILLLANCFLAKFVKLSSHALEKKCYCYQTFGLGLAMLGWRPVDNQLNLPFPLEPI